jgi:hypothetical protein
VGQSGASGSITECVQWHRLHACVLLTFILIRLKKSKTDRLKPVLLWKFDDCGEKSVGSVFGRERSEEAIRVN